MAIIQLISLVLFFLVIKSDARNVTSTGGDLCPPVAECIARLDEGRSCDLLPVPDHARIELIPSGYKLTKAARDGVWFYEDLAYNSIILYKGSRLAVLDFPTTAGAEGKPLIIDAVAEVLGGKAPGRIDMVYSHAHYDHIGGATQFYEWAKGKYPSATIFVWGTYETRRFIQASKTKRAVLPNVIVRSRGRTLTLSPDLEVKMSLIGGHTIQDLLLHIVPHGDMPGIVMMVDIVYPRWAPFFNLGVTDNVGRAIEVQKELLDLDFYKFVGGHVQIGTKADVRESYRYYKDLIKAAEEGLDVNPEEFDNSGFAKAFNPSLVEYNNLWFAVGALRGIQVAKCKRIMIEKWGCRIGGLDITIGSHCFTAVTYAILEL